MWAKPYLVKTMGFINKEQMEKRLDTPANLIKRAEIVPSAEPSAENDQASFDQNKFKKDGVPREKPIFSTEMRAALAAATLMTSATEAAEAFERSPSYAAQLAKGEASRDIDLLKREDANSKLRAEIYDQLGGIREAARAKLLKVLNIIDDDSLGAIAPKDKLRIAASAANQLAGVIDKTIEKGQGLTDQRSAHLHLYSPQQREAAEYNIVKVGAPVPESNLENAIDVTPTE